MESVYTCLKICNSINLCADPYVPTARLEMIPKLHAYSTSMINIVTVNGKQLQKSA